MPYTRASFLFLCLAIVLLGCGQSDSVACFLVCGQVLHEGEPLPEAMVVFHPVAPSEAGTPKPLAYSDEQGRFELSTFATRDGAPPGEYVITVELRAPRQVGEETVRDGRNLLPPVYADPQTSPLRYTVVEGENEVPPLQMK